MKLDNKGWGLSAMIGFCCILGVAILIVVILVDQTFGDHPRTPSHNSRPSTNTNQGSGSSGAKSYQELEANVIAATKKYQEKYYGENLLEDDQIVVTVASLISNQYLKDLKDIKNTANPCTGYGTFIKKDGILEYHAYIRCGTNYETEGYLPRLDDRGE